MGAGNFIYIYPERSMQAPEVFVLKSLGVLEAKLSAWQYTESFGAYKIVILAF